MCERKEIKERESMYVNEKVRQREGVCECERGITRWRKREMEIKKGRQGCRGKGIGREGKREKDRGIERE